MRMRLQRWCGVNGQGTASQEDRSGAGTVYHGKVLSYFRTFGLPYGVGTRGSQVCSVWRVLRCTWDSPSTL
jgi:hypothetical protein